MFTKKPVYSAEMVRYALLLGCTSIQSYRILLEHFPLPSLLLLHKISSGTIDDVKCAQTLGNQGKVSSDVCLMFDEMYLEKCEGYFAEDLMGCNSEGELYKGLVCFMIVGLKNSIPYVIKSSPETKINADWLKKEITNCLGILSKSGFNVRAIVCDNHTSNVSSFKNLLQHFNQDPEELFIWYELRKIYLFYDAVHLAKNIRNNLLNYKRFIFPSLKFDGFKYYINVTGGETKWKYSHDVHEKDALLEEHLRKAPKLTTKVLHPGNCKQKVPTALEIFHETTAAGIQSYFPDAKNTVEFLKFFSKWWVISNSKTALITNSYLVNVAINGDQKPSFLRGVAEWVQTWQTERIPNCKKFMLTAQTSSAIVRTFFSLASLIEDLLGEGYDFELISRF